MSPNSSSVVKWTLSRLLFFRLLLQKLRKFVRIVASFSINFLVLNLSSLKISNRYFAKSAFRPLMRVLVPRMDIYNDLPQWYAYLRPFVKHNVAVQRESYATKVHAHYNLFTLICAACVIQTILNGSSSKYFYNFMLRKSNKIKHNELRQNKLNFTARFFLIHLFYILIYIILIYIITFILHFNIYIYIAPHFYWIKFYSWITCNVMPICLFGSTIFAYRKCFIQTAFRTRVLF